MNKLVLLILAMLTTFGCFAQTSNEGFYAGKREGWFFHKDPKEQKVKPPVVPPAPPPESTKSVEKPPGPVVQKAPPFSVKWLRENLDTLRDAAIDNPTQENVSAYYYAQRVLLDKADRFATISQQVVLSDPYLDENNNFPFATAARANVMRLREDAKKAGLAHVATKAGIWFFFDSKCTYCAMQISVLKHFADDYGFVVKAISLDGKTLPGLPFPVVKDQGQFKSLNLSLTPTIVLALPPKTFLIVSQGLLDNASADDRLLSAAATQQILPPEIAKEIDVFAKGVLTVEDLTSDEAKQSTEKTSTWVEYLRGKLKNRY